LSKPKSTAAATEAIDATQQPTAVAAIATAALVLKAGTTRLLEATAALS
jgi:hypothetical protein